jgi:5-methylcytosine-specific restriction endonuclease McrA
MRTSIGIGARNAWKSRKRCNLICYQLKAMTLAKLFRIMKRKDNPPEKRPRGRPRIWATDSARHNAWAKRARLKLIALLGGMCVNCGATEDLEIDHIDASKKEKPTHVMSSRGRIGEYKRQIAIGNAQVLCGRCNSKKGDREQIQLELTEQPY